MSSYILAELIQCLQVTIALFLGAVLGWQRVTWGKPAGPRTYALVSGGAALFTILAHVGFGSLAGGSGIAAGIVTGIGFLGAGLIFHRETHIDGLTTAAGLWASAAIGMAIGLEYFILGIISTVLVFFVLAFDDQRLHGKSTRLLKDDGSSK